MNPFYIVVALPLLLGGCAATSTDVTTYDDSADPAYGVKPVSYTTPVTGYVHRIPVNPRPWRGQNDAQAPKGGTS